MTAVPEPTGTLTAALEHTMRLLKSNPVLAAEQASEILKVAPLHPVASMLLGVARRQAGDPLAALKVLEPLVAGQPQWATAHYETGITLGALDRRDEALAALRRAVALRPDMPDAWREIGDLLTVQGDSTGADAAYAQHIKASTKDPRLMSAALALSENRIPEAELLLREHLKQYPTDVAAIRMLAEVAGRLGRNHDAETLLVRCLELAPSFNAARHNYALALHRQNKSAAALQQIDRLTASEPRNAGYRNLKAAILVNIGNYQESIEIYADVLAKHPEQSKIWMSYGHALATAGRQQDSIAAYRRCIDLAPGLGEAYYSLANLKTFRFSDAELQAMRAHLAGTDITKADRAHFHFSVGKALEDSGAYAESFEHYAAGNELRLARVGYDAAATTAHVRRSKALFTKEFVAARADFGAPPADPIFIVGLPRAGSTLIEQILASHSCVEGTMELPDVMAIAANLGGLQDGKRGRSQESAYPEVLATLSAAQCRALGDRYIEQTRIQRKSSKAFFIDKMPNNFLHIGLLHLALPNAKIIDARRHPMACCFSGFKQNFAQGQRYTYNLEDIGRFYCDYVELMAHFDAVLPGKVHRVIYERLIEDTEAEVRRLLAFCQLPFEEACLRYYENDRAVRTASSQQVRKPIYREGIDHWRNFEPWLEPLRRALGDVLAAYPDTPQYENRQECGIH
jgi:tetratricopeptide (TPR) repeat protein